MARARAAFAGTVLGLAAVTGTAQDLSHMSPERGAAVLERAVASLGGAAAVDGIRTLEIKGVGKRWAADKSVEVKTLVRMRFPERYRQEVVLPMGTMTTVLNPQGAFVMTDKGSMPLSVVERAGLEASLERNIIAILQSRNRPTSPAVWTQTAEMDKDKERLEIVSIGSKVASTLGIDAESGLIRQIAYMSSAPGTFGLVRIRYSDYRAAGPIKYPFRAVGTLDGKPLFETTVEAVIVNGTMADSLFVPVAPMLDAPPARLPSPSPSP